MKNKYIYEVIRKMNNKEMFALTIAGVLFIIAIKYISSLPLGGV